MLPPNFVTGACKFADTAPGTPYEARIFVPVRLTGLEVDVIATVDAAAPWCLLEGPIAAMLTDRDPVLFRP